MHVMVVTHLARRRPDGDIDISSSIFSSYGDIEELKKRAIQIVREERPEYEILPNQTVLVADAPFPKFVKI